MNLKEENLNSVLGDQGMSIWNVGGLKGHRRRRELVPGKKGSCVHKQDYRKSFLPWKCFGMREDIVHFPSGLTVMFAVVDVALTRVMAEILWWFCSRTWPLKWMENSSGPELIPIRCQLMWSWAQTVISERKEEIGPKQAVSTQIRAERLLCMSHCAGFWSVDTLIVVPTLERQISKWWANESSWFIAVRGTTEVRIEPRDGGCWVRNELLGDQADEGTK